MAERYKMAEKSVFEKLEQWQRVAVEEDRALGNWNSTIMDRFAKDVVKVAEDMEAAPDPSRTDKVETKNPISKPKDVPDWHKFNGANGTDESQLYN